MMIGQYFLATKILVIIYFRCATRSYICTYLHIHMNTHRACATFSDGCNSAVTKQVFHRTSDVRRLAVGKIWFDWYMKNHGYTRSARSCVQPANSLGSHKSVLRNKFDYGLKNCYQTITIAEALPHYDIGLHNTRSQGFRTNMQFYPLHLPEFSSCLHTCDE